VARSKKFKTATRGPGTAALPARIDKALRENRTQQALELARTLHRQDNSPANRELLKRTALARAADLTAHGHQRDAAAVLASILALDSAPEFLAQVATRFADIGDLGRALELQGKLTDPKLQAQVMAHVADEVVRQGPAAKSHLPAALQGQTDVIWQAFTHAEKGEDDAARDQLQGIGLQSPLLEWKLLLRGLLAYYASEDARALDNWQRLDPQRLPFRLAAPLRFAIDKEFARSQPPAAQYLLQQQTLRLHGSGLPQQLRAIQAAMANERQLPQAFRLAEQTLPQLRAEAPHLVPRLAGCFYWAIIHHGMPEDMKRYERAFGAPTDDPDMARLEALALEQRGDLHIAHKHWQRFEKSVARSKAWPQEQKDRVRALIWTRMGRNADSVPDLDELQIPLGFRDHPGRPRPLKPGPEECFEKALALVPDQLTVHQELVGHLLHKENDKKAEAAARRLLEHFPDDAPTLEVLGDLLMKTERHAEARDLFQRALNVNPLEQRMRHKLATAHSYQARTLADQGRFDDARAAYQAALAIDDRREKYPILCKWAACEFKAGATARAEELLQQAYAEKDSKLAVVFTMLIETIRFKLTKLKAQFNKEFNALLGEPPTGAAATALAETAAEHRQAGVKYHGQQTHEKKVKTYLEKALRASFTEQELRQTCTALEALKLRRLHLDYIELGQRQFPNDPYFFLAEAEYELAQANLYGYRHYQATEALARARKLTEKMPRSDRQEEMFRRIQDCELRLRELNPFSDIFESLFGSSGPFDPFGPFDDEDEDDYDDEDF
jgi:tetratricopeptide (TPR) repeat protein